MKGEKTQLSDTIEWVDFKFLGVQYKKMKVGTIKHKTPTHISELDNSSSLFY